MASLFTSIFVITSMDDSEILTSEVSRNGPRRKRGKLFNHDSHKSIAAITEDEKLSISLPYDLLYPSKASVLFLAIWFPVISALITDQ